MFSGKDEPARDTCTEANECDFARFRTVMLKLDRIHNDENEKNLKETLLSYAQEIIRQGKIDHSESYEFEDAIEWFEKVNGLLESVI